MAFLESDRLSFDMQLVISLLRIHQRRRLIRLRHRLRTTYRSNLGAIESVSTTIVNEEIENFFRLIKNEWET
jgi:hypothetical protein